LRARRIERSAAGEGPAGQRVADDIEILREDLRTLRTVEPECRKGGRITSGPDPEFKATVRHQIKDGGVFRHPHRVLQRQRHDTGAEANAGGLRGDIAEEGERGRKPAFSLVKMVLGDPRGIEPAFLSVPDLLRREAIAFSRRSGVEKPREEP